MKLKIETLYAIGYRNKASDTWSIAHKSVNYDKALVAGLLPACIDLGPDYVEYTLLRIDSHGVENITHIKSGKLYVADEIDKLKIDYSLEDDNDAA